VPLPKQKNAPIEDPDLIGTRVGAKFLTRLTIPQNKSLSSKVRTFLKKILVFCFQWDRGSKNLPSRGHEKMPRRAKIRENGRKLV